MHNTLCKWSCQSKVLNHQVRCQGIEGVRDGLVKAREVARFVVFVQGDDMMAHDEEVVNGSGLCGSEVHGSDLCSLASSTAEHLHSGQLNGFKGCIIL
jgi:hypothetical protein